MRAAILPLYENAVELIRLNLEAISAKTRAKPVLIGTLTNVQRDAINAHRMHSNPQFQLIVSEVVFVGAHIHKRRIVEDGYTIDDVIAQIVSAMSDDSVFLGGSPMQTIGSIHPRRDRLGNSSIKDHAVFECTSRRPTAELFSVIPKGDKIKPTK